ncbi:amidohydrolase [Georgenia sp. MJ170]|uniref:amidohydrolase n=1 Tax=Georgenia sunbinii TaxID=3117728 RepID=UPI002F26BE1B
MPPLLLRGVRLVPVGGTRPTADPARAARPSDAPVDVRLAGGRVTEVAPRLRARPDETVMEAEGRWAIPGLWDQHVHSGQWASSFTRLDLGAATSAAEVVERVRLAAADRGAAGAMLEGYGFRDALWPDLPTTAALDAVAPHVPVVLISGDVHCGWLNSAALRQLGLPPTADVVREHEWFDALARLGQRSRPDDGYARAVAHAAARGVVGIVDMEFAPNHRQWPSRIAGGIDALRVRTGVYLDDLDDVLDAGLRTGDELAGGRGLLTMGPVKVITDGALNTRTAFCHEPYAMPRGEATAGRPDLADPGNGELTVPLEELCALMRRGHDGGLEMAVHAIGDAANHVALDAFAATGARGSIEHAQLLAPADVPRFASLGVAASVQPAHLLDDRDVVEAYWPGRGGATFPLRALLDAGAQLRFGSDAPVAPMDPWLAMAAAVHRAADDRAPWHPEQHITPAEALAASTDGWGTVAPGHPADIVLLDSDPLARTDGTAAAVLRTMAVHTTVAAGRITHQTP